MWCAPCSCARCKTWWCSGRLQSSIDVLVEYCWIWLSRLRGDGGVMWVGGVCLRSGALCWQGTGDPVFSESGQAEQYTDPHQQLIHKQTWTTDDRLFRCLRCFHVLASYRNVRSTVPCAQCSLCSHDFPTMSRALSFRALILQAVSPIWAAFVLHANLAFRW